MKTFGFIKGITGHRNNLHKYPYGYYRLRRINKDDYNIDWDEWDNAFKKQSHFQSSLLKKNDYMSLLFHPNLDNYYYSCNAKKINNDRSEKLKSIIND